MTIDHLKLFLECRKTLILFTFLGEMEGSRKYKELYSNAKQFFESSTENVYHNRLDRLMAIVGKFESGDISKPDSGWLPPPGQPDSESWMEVTPESLDQMLAARFGVPQGGEDKIPGALNDFLNKMSDMSGVEDDSDMNFQAEGLIASMKKLLGENAGELDKDNIDDNENISDSEDSDEDYDGDDNDDPVIVDYMSRLDAEIGASMAGRSDLPDLEQPLQVDSNALTNLLASYSAEFGFSGPASSMLNTIGVNPGVKKE